MNSKYIYVIIVVVILIGLFFAREYGSKTSNIPITKYDAFGQCLKDAGAKFYGAYWCKHCQEQKQILDNSKKIPYIECSTPNGEAQLKICTDEKISGYPTWKFADGTTLDGVLSIEKLSEKTNCALPSV